ncbi:ATP-binding protein [Streptomyces sp. NPDC059913]|uniref:ATP-binding protein n=1 Tax=unclassified Streptomyces TaxID=2593676 RepID=UPI00365EC4B0
MDVQPDGPRPVDWGLAHGLGTPRFAARRFTASKLSLLRARRFAYTTLTSWGLDQCADEATLVAVELMTNAAEHALDADEYGGRDSAWLGLSCTARTVTCTVSDPSTRPPRNAPNDLLADTGRGMAIVAVLSDGWGCNILSDGTGKTVWAHLRT